MSLLHFVSNMTQFKQINPQFITRTILKGEPFLWKVEFKHLYHGEYYGDLWTLSYIFFLSYMYLGNGTDKLKLENNNLFSPRANFWRL